MTKLTKLEILELKRLIYRCPLPKKKQRIEEKGEKNGPVKIYSREEIKEFERTKGKDDST